MDSLKANAYMHGVRAYNEKRDKNENPYQRETEFWILFNLGYSTAVAVYAQLELMSAMRKAADKLKQERPGLQGAKPETAQA